MKKTTITINKSVVYFELENYHFYYFHWCRSFLSIILFPGAFQCLESNGSNGFEETELVFLKGILNSPAVTQTFKVGLCFLFYLNFFYRLRKKVEQTQKPKQPLFRSINDKEALNQLRILLSLNNSKFKMKLKVNECYWPS